MKVLIVNAHYSKVLGGSEIQCHQIASGLHEQGVEVVYVAIKGLGENTASLPYPVVSCEANGASITAACMENQADIVYWRYNKKSLTQVVKALTNKGVPLVFSVSHIHDLKPFAYKPIPGLSIIQRARRRLSHLLRGWAFAKGLKMVSGVICNNSGHLAEIAHAHKTYIPNSPFLEFSEFKWERPYVVWVGNLKEHKHPELFLQLSKDLEALGVDFLMAGHIQQPAYEYMNDKSGLPDNFHFLGPGTVLEANGMIRNALMLVHTCEPEGFPNVFLQAWGFGKPVVSAFFDPGGKIESAKAGLLSGDYKQLKADVQSLIEDQNRREELGTNALDLIQREFIRDHNIRQLTTFLQQTLERKR